MLMIAGIISPEMNYWKDPSLGSNNPELHLRCKSIREAALRLDQQIPWASFWHGIIVMFTYVDNKLTESFTVHLQFAFRNETGSGGSHL